MDIFGLAILAHLLSGVGSGVLGGAASMASAQASTRAANQLAEAMMRVERQKRIAEMLNRWQGRS